MDLRQQVTRYLASQPQFNPSGLLRLQILGYDLGWVEPSTAAFLQAHSPAFVVHDQHLIVTAADAATTASVLTHAALAMRDHGLIKGWRNELYTVFAPAAHCKPDRKPDLAQPLFTLERGAFRRFGLTSLAVHINGWCANRQLWIAQRASSKAVDPDRLDNIAAGGITAGENPGHCAVRELGEEAGILPELARQMVPTASIHSCRNEIDGTHDEILYCYDLVLPADFIPHNTDGEVAGFRLLDVENTVASLERLTGDAGLVTAHFLLRQQWV